MPTWVARGESETLEFKERTSGGCLREGTETACAFLNTKGGRLLFGVEKSGRITGQDVSPRTLEDVAGWLRRIEPPTTPEVEAVGIGDGSRSVVVVTVQRSHRRPHTFQGTAYRRVGATTSALSRAEYNEMLFEAFHATRRWENEEAAGWGVKDLDQTEITRTVEAAIQAGRLDEPGSRDPAEMLRGLSLLPDGRLLRAAVVLFARGDRLATDFPQCRLRLARFRGIDKTEFIDNRQFHGNAFFLLRQADQFLRTHLPVAGRIVAGVFERTDDPMYPPLALREALANALCHRDYSIGGGSVGIAIYDDRLEISSSGGLHFGLTVEDLYQPHESLPWNPIIADVFFRRGLIETWGRGTLKIAELAERAGQPRPEFEDSPGALLVRFRPSGYLAPSRIGHDLTAQQQDILHILASEGSLPLNRIVRALGEEAERRSVQTDLQLLRSWELVVSSGWGRGAEWRLRDR